ncbi:hypothetical protein J6590_033851 [Homalodisca vitripennis]|nr:hypothetical protein J6590_033851 [Homalodisca vitripennis]
MLCGHKRWTKCFGCKKCGSINKCEPLPSQRPLPIVMEIIEALIAEMTDDPGPSSRLRLLKGLELCDFGALKVFDDIRTRKVDTAAREMTEESGVPKRSKRLAESEGGGDHYCPEGF